MSKLSYLPIALIGLVSFPCMAQQEEIVRDEDVKIVAFEEFKYPLKARVSHVEGVVVVRVNLNDTGHVISSVPISGAKQLLPDCLANAKKWRFQANHTKTAIIVYEFRIEGFCYGLTASQFIFRPPNHASITSCDTFMED